MLWVWFLAACFSLSAFEKAPSPAVYAELSNSKDPSLEDLQKIQRFLIGAERPELRRLKDKEDVIRKMKIVGEKELPLSLFYAVNCGEGERENCVIVYTSFNERYPEGAKRLAETIAKSDFKGHVRVRIGGWPDAAGGSLCLVHVPFAFKACFFKEVQAAGYKKVLWLDASILPVVSLNEIFQKIHEKGYFVQEGYHPLTRDVFVDDKTAAAFGLSAEEASRMQSCSAAILGLDLTQEKPKQLLCSWYEAAFDPYAFFSPRSDQTALSILMHQLGMTDWTPLKTLAYSSKLANKKRHLFVMDREFVKLQL